ncbi:MAG: hypothetical protein M1835_001446, partial [Candelina submexicana]
MDEWHSRYCQHYNQQEDLIKADADFNALYEALPKLPKVSMISLIDSWQRCSLMKGPGSNRGNGCLYHYRGDLDGRPYDVPLSRRWTKYIGKTFYGSGDPPPPVAWQESVGGDLQYLEKSVRGFRTVVRALSQTKHNIQVFFVDSLSEAELPGIPSIFLRTSPEEFRQACSFFSSLRRIVLQINVDNTEGLRIGNLVAMLESARLLEDLTVVVDFPYDFSMHLDRLVGTGRWNHLHTVDFDVQDHENKGDL